MRKEYLIVALGLFAAAGTAVADDLAVPAAEAPAQDAPAADAPPAPDAPTPTALPSKGISMAAVKKQFGEPRTTRGPVGGDTPKHPPITRWDYDGFVVIFEKDRVVDAVVPGAPPKLRTTAGLTPATNAPTPPSMPAPDQPPVPDQPPPPEAAASEAAPAEAEPIIPEAPAEQPAPPMEPTAQAPAAEPVPPPAAEPPVQQMQPAPVEQPLPNEDGPPTPKS